MSEFTPTERAILDLLSDERSHSRSEIHKCLPDDLSAVRAIRKHLSNIRRKVRPHGVDIVCEIRSGATYYRKAYGTPQEE